MCEEVRAPATQVPKAMVLTIMFNLAAGLLTLIPLVFVLPDIQELILLAQPVPAIVKSAVGSPGGAFGLLIPIIVLGIICGIGCTTATSRSIYAFSRDGAIPGSNWWKIVHPKLDVPVNAMMLSMVIQVGLGAIYFGSPAAFNAFSGVGVIALTAAYSAPIVVSMLEGRKTVATGAFYLGKIGWFCNIVSVGKMSPVLSILHVFFWLTQSQPGPRLSYLFSRCRPRFPLSILVSPTTPLWSSWALP